MNIAHPVLATVESLGFSFLTADDIRRISVKQVINPTLLDEINRPNIGGLYDPALGPSDARDICATCRLTYFTCPGHFGHIELPAPVYHPLFMSNMLNILRGTCLFCHRFKLNPVLLCKFAARLRLLERGLLDAANAVNDMQRKTSKRGDKKGLKAFDDDENDDESVAAFVNRVKLFTAMVTAKAPSRTRDHHKDMLVYEARKTVILSFLRLAAAQKKCGHEECSGFSFSLRKEGHTKVIEYELTKKQKAQHDLVGKRRPDVLMSEKARRTIPEMPNGRSNGVNPDIDMMDGTDSESEGEGDDILHSEEELDGASPLALSPQALAKSASGKVKGARGRNERIIPPEECRAHLRLLFNKEPELCSLLFGRHGPLTPLGRGGLSTVSADMFFMDVVPVSPTRFRPPVKLGETLFEHPQNELLAKVLNTSYRLRDLNDDLRAAEAKHSAADETTKRALTSRLLEGLVQLQHDVNSFIDSSKNPAVMRQGKLPPAGVKQGLEKKEGLFRKNMMGKRVNYAARSVISPDVNIEPNEIGIPPVFARKLTFPEPVTAANIHEAMEWVKAGPKGYPGATMIEYEDGHQQLLDKLSLDQRVAIANQLLKPQEGQAYTAGRRGLHTRTPAINVKVYRHLRDGDILILNRQPTLHKPSMMAHKARVLTGEKTIRMHYANCNSYNADFDGDEMNIHFPQNHVARAESYFIANTDNQYLVPTSGKPLRGLIQDHVVAGVWMTSLDSFFTREEYFQLLYGALRPEEYSHHSGRLVTLPPAICKPRPLWTGKQIISTVLANITPSNTKGLNLNAKAQVPGKLWGEWSSEEQVIFRDGQLLSGVLDKSAFGASEYGMVHSVYELYGAESASVLLGVLSRLFTKLMQHRAFTCRMDDLCLTPKGNAARADIIRKAAATGTEAAVENFPSLSSTPKADVPTALRLLLQDVLRDDSKMAALDMTVKGKVNKLTASITSAVMPSGLLRRFPDNNMQTMTISGAKGSAVNANSISCALGQQELEGRRVPVMVSGKTLPSFKAFETKAIAGGYVSSRYLTGVRPQEFFFHCMAGREGLIDTAVKTSRSGYLQRCLIKHLEGVRVHYDNTVRGSDSSVYQFHYGGDALDVTKQKHLYQFEFVARNQESIYNHYKFKNLLESSTIDKSEATEYMKKIIKKPVVRPNKLTPAEREQHTPALSKFDPTRFLGSTSEKFAEAVDQYVKQNPDKLLQTKETKAEGIKRRTPLIGKTQFKALMNAKYMRSLVEPGEAVGLLASQGVGEPSTQMTLNTFHFAGHGAANVTLGIPRLREIVMTASSKPRTPSMTMLVREDADPADVTKFCQRASRLTLSQLVDRVDVREGLALQGDERNTEYKIDINFYPREEYEAEYDVTLEEIRAAFGRNFSIILKREVIMEMKKLDADLRQQIAQLGKGTKSKEGPERAGGRGEDEDIEDEVADEDGDDGSDDAEDTEAKRARQKTGYESDGETSDDEDQGPYGDEELEQQFADEEKQAPAMKTANVKKPAEKDIPKTMEELFKMNFPAATHIECTDAKCTFGLRFNADTPKLLLVGIVERACRKAIVREIPGIVDCFKSEEKRNDAPPVIELITNGSNLPGLWRFAVTMELDILHEEVIHSNDIYAILKAYGVEAARATILREVSSVFAVYNIKVDSRHLELIADYMTFEGGYKPFNRAGISSNPSPLLKASYETTASFISDAVLYGDFDDLTTPSSNIVLGRPGRTGTGAFDVVMSSEPSI